MNRYNQAPHLTQDTTWESNKKTIKYHTQQSQMASPFPADDNMVTINKHGYNLFVCNVALRPKSTAMVIAGRSVHLTTLFPGQA